MARVREDGPANRVPAFVTHYYRADRRPFLNLSDLAGEQLASTLAGLATPEDRALSERRFGRRYMDLRRATEARARDLFIAVGGRPERTTPHYFVLGASAWFAGLYRDVAAIRLPLADLPPSVTTATYGDSISAMGLGVPLGLPEPQPAHAGRLYRIEEVEDLVARYGLPDDTPPKGRDGYTGRQHQRVTRTSRSDCGPTNPSAHTWPATDRTPGGPARSRQITGRGWSAFDVQDVRGRTHEQQIVVMS